MLDYTPLTRIQVYTTAAVVGNFIAFLGQKSIKITRLQAVTSNSQYCTSTLANFHQNFLVVDYSNSMLYIFCPTEVIM